MNENKIKVLIVDDYASIRKVIRNLLKQSGYKDIVEAEDGVMALRTLKSQKIDIVVSDWNMPNMSGLELLKTVRADPDLAKMPFLMITAEALHDNVVAAVKAGVSNYIVKPFTAEILHEKIKRIMDNL